MELFVIHHYYKFLVKTFFNTIVSSHQFIFQNIGIPSTTKNQLIGVFSNFDSGSIFSLEIRSFKTFSNDYCWIIFARNWQFQFTEIQLIPNKCVPVLILKDCTSFSFPTCQEELFTKIMTCPLLGTLLETYEFPSELISFEEKCSHNCKLLIAWKCSAWLRCMQFNRYFSSISHNSDCDETDGKLLETINFQTFENAMINHRSQITAVLYISSLNILITGDRCGTIKVCILQNVAYILKLINQTKNAMIHFSCLLELTNSKYQRSIQILRTYCFITVKINTVFRYKIRDNRYYSTAGTLAT